MAGEVGGKKGKGVVAINIIPLVDVMLVLAAVQTAKNIPVQVPKASTGAAGVSTAINLSVEKSGILRLDGAVVDAAAAQRMLRENIRRDSTTQVLLSADEALNYSRVVEVLDLIRAAGVGRYALKVRAAGS